MARATRTGSDPDMLGRANSAIANGALTNSKRPETFVKGVYPSHLTRGHGAFIWDTNGNRYIDFICGLGSSILGYANEEVNEAIRIQLLNGCTLSLGTEMEVRTAEKIKEIFPWVDRVRFLKTGTDACQAAIRISRGKTKREYVLSSGYHGWGEEFCHSYAAGTGMEPSAGVPRWAGSYIGTYSGNEAMQRVAALIVEPVITDASRGRMDELTAMRKHCDDTGVALVFDEIITGFRFQNWSVSNTSGVQPDLICLGKAIANGMPLSVVAGKKETMEGSDYFVSSTFAGETLSLAAAYKTISLLQTKYSLSHLWDKGAQFLLKFNELWRDGVTIEGYPTRGAFVGDPLTKALFWQESCRAGILFGPSWFFNFSHIELMDPVLATCKDILTRIRLGQVKLEGEMPKSPISQKARQS